MAMGDNSIQQNNNRVYENTYYSRFKINNNEEGLALSANFTRGLLIPVISKKGSANTRPEELASVNVSPTKASILADLGKRYLETEYSDIKVYGIDTGIGETRGFIGFQNMDDKRSLIIGKISPEGDFSGVTFPFHTDDYMYTLLISSMSNMDFTKEPVASDFEVKKFIELLEDFGRHSNDAIAYSVADTTRYDNKHLNSTVNLIAEAMNIQTKFSSGNNKSSNAPSYFDNNKGANSSSNTNRGRSNHMSEDEVNELLD